MDKKPIDECPGSDSDIGDGSLLPERGLLVHSSPIEDNVSVNKDMKSRRLKLESVAFMEPLEYKEYVNRDDPKIATQGDYHDGAYELEPVFADDLSDLVDATRKLDVSHQEEPSTSKSIDIPNSMPKLSHDDDEKETQNVLPSSDTDLISSAQHVSCQKDLETRYLSAYVLAVLAGGDAATVLRCVGIEADQEILKKIIGEANGKSIDQLIAQVRESSMPSGGAAPAAAAAESESEDEDMGF